MQGNPGPIGPKGDIGPIGPQGDPGPARPPGPKGERGEPGERGPAGEQRPIGMQGPQGELEPQGIQGDKGCPGSQGEQGIPGPEGPAGPKGDTGEKDEKGDTGEQGPKGDKGDTGETPVITVVEDTPLSYKLNFKTSTEDITTPNLFKSLDEYHVDLSATGSTLNIPLDNLILTYQNTSTTSVQISVAAKDTAVPVLTDMRRITIYNGSSVESQTYDNTSVSTRTVLDDLMYTQSQESHSIMIRQQNPDSLLYLKQSGKNVYLGAMERNRCKLCSTFCIDEKTP